jgi:hypothetical protein
MKPNKNLSCAYPNPECPLGGPDSTTLPCPVSDNLLKGTTDYHKDFLELLVHRRISPAPENGKIELYNF